MHKTIKLTTPTPFTSFPRNPQSSRRKSEFRAEFHKRRRRVWGRICTAAIQVSTNASVLKCGMFSVWIPSRHPQAPADIPTSVRSMALSHLEDRCLLVFLSGFGGVSMFFYIPRPPELGTQQCSCLCVSQDCRNWEGTLEIIPTCHQHPLLAGGSGRAACSELCIWIVAGGS